MDNIRNQFNTGRSAMIDAFVELSTLARRLGVAEDELTPVHGRFFDGNVQTKRAFNILLLLAEVWQPRRERPAQRRCHRLCHRRALRCR